MGRLDVFDIALLRLGEERSTGNMSNHQGVREALLAETGLHCRLRKENG